MSEEHDDAVTETHDGETTGEALDALRAILAEMRDDRIIRLNGEDVTRCMLHNLADRIEAAAERVKVAHWCECERKRLLIGRLAQRVKFARLAERNPGGEDSLLREAQYEIEGTPYAVIDGKPVVVLHGRVVRLTDGRTYVVNRPDAGEVAHG